MNNFNTEILTKAITAIAFGITGAIFITPVFIFLRKLFFGPFTNKKLVERAKSKGNVITARLVDHYSLNNHSGNHIKMTGEEMGIYEYEINERKYKYRFMSFNALPQELTLYYLNNPKKATVPSELFIRQRSPWIRSFLIIAFIFWLIGFVCLLNINI